MWIKEQKQTKFDFVFCKLSFEYGFLNVAFQVLMSQFKNGIRQNNSHWNIHLLNYLTWQSGFSVSHFQ